MTQVIEIVVIGAVGSGKSHVLELIDRALHNEYGQHVQVTSHELSRERYMGSPGTKPKVAETIFNLREQTPASSKLGEVEVSVDTSALTSALETLGGVQGEAVSFMLDPLEQAIESTVRVMQGERDQCSEITTTESGNVSTTSLYARLGKHLDELLGAQLKRVTTHEAG
jgi:energy-coupling factor transporter ATP-binding protein EcfA2